MTDNTDDHTHELDDDAQAGLAQMLAGGAEPSLEDFKPSMPGNINPEILQNISVTLSIEVGRAQIKIKDLMRLTQGSVVELDRIAGEPLDLLVNNSVVAQGEIVLVNDRYGVRLTRVVPSSERLKLI
jgi:flagellar motor switch protein FliN/FliY